MKLSGVQVLGPSSLRSTGWALPDRGAGISRAVLSDENLIGTMFGNFTSSALYPRAAVKLAELAERLPVGKRKGCHSKSQAEINDLLVSLGREGKRVVRLKSGDPLIFGRAGEEIDHLKARGIPVTVIPGITAALGVLQLRGFWVCQMHRRRFAACSASNERVVAFAIHHGVATGGAGWAV